jgi:hypothetical protein
VLGLVALFAISFVTLIAFAIPKYITHLQTGMTYAVILPAFCGIAYFVAPIAMRHIRATTSQVLKASPKRTGRILAALMVLLSSLLGYCLPYAERSFTTEPLFSSSLAATTLDLFVSLIVAFPYAVLFIALTLIVDGDVGDEIAGDLIGGDGAETLTTPY